MKNFYRILLVMSLCTLPVSAYFLVNSSSFRTQEAKTQRLIFRSHYRGFSLGAIFAVATGISCAGLCREDKSECIDVAITEEGEKALSSSQKRAVAEKLIAAAEKEEALSAFSDEWDNLNK